MQSVLVIILLSGIRVGLCIDPGVYQKQFKAQVVPPYKTAVDLVAASIDDLAKSPIPTTSEAAKKVLDELNTRAHKISEQLDAAAQAADAILVHVDQDAEALAAAVEQNITSNDQQLQQITERIKQTTKRVNAAKEEVKRATVAFEDKRRRENDARKKCASIGGGLAGFLCNVLIRIAEGESNRAQKALNCSQQSLDQKQAELTGFEQEKATLESKKTELNGQFDQIHQAHDQIFNVTSLLKIAMTRLTTPFEKSQSLVEVIKQLIDTGTVLKPLTAIADQIVRYTKNQDDVAFCSLEKIKITVNLSEMQQKLSQYAPVPSVG